MSEAPWAGRLAVLFRPLPHRWGLRGDPHLWAEMEQEFREVDLPPAPETVAARVEEAFARLTGRPMSHPGPFFVSRYDHGGMSSGHVNPAWWRDTGLPLLLERHARQHGTG